MLGLFCREFKGIKHAFFIQVRFVSGSGVNSTMTLYRNVQKERLSNVITVDKMKS
jgi:hypothetical protein